MLKFYSNASSVAGIQTTGGPLVRLLLLLLSCDTKDYDDED